MTKEKKQVNEIKKKEKFIYCGPNIGFKVIKDTVYIGGIPKILDEEIKECKEIKNLFIPLEFYIETKRKILEEGTIENLSYKAVQSFLKDKRGEK
ncbi:hypothetical protein ACR77J_16340 [Tissierella praeacuta]|uniref:hypothetical protein n=1 Tax=Tissierella praeacuta TaxID=43131 RepID=UPI003DA5E2F8